MLIYVYLLVRPVALFILLILGAFLAMRAGYPRLSLAVAVLLLIYGISTEALNKSAHSFGKPAPQGVRLLLFLFTTKPDHLRDTTDTEDTEFSATTLAA